LVGKDAENARLRNEEVDEPYAVGMAAAMKQTGDTPPLKKSTINKAHEIAKSIKKEALDSVGKHDADIDNDGDTDKTDKYLIRRRKAIARAIDEVSDQKLDVYRRKAFDDQPAGDGSEKYSKRKFGRDLAFAKQTGRAKVLATKEEVEGLVDEQIDLAGEVHKAKTFRSNKFDLLRRPKTPINKKTGKAWDFHVRGKKEFIQATLGKHPKPNLPEEVEDLDEAFKIGAMHLEDGSSVTLTRENVDCLNNLFNQLNSSNRAKMEERLKSSKNGFNEIMGFAKEIE
jgi:hypothetical protein